MSEERITENQKLDPYFSRVGTWAFSIGTSIGWGSFVVTCNTYLFQAGIMGTVLGLLVGMAVILVINRNLCYVMERKPGAGGIYSYGEVIRGHDTGFLIAWFLLLTYMAVLWANITSLPLFAGRFLGPFFKFGYCYTVFGYEVYFGEALLSIAAIVLVGALCSVSRKIPQYLMIIMALIFVGGLIAVTVIALAGHGGSGMTYDPMYIPDKSEWGQVVRIAAISPWAFIGFENVAHFSEEFKYPVKKVRGVMLASVIMTTLVYIMMSLLSVSAFPPEYANWFEYIGDMGNLQGIKAIPAFYAAQHYMGQAGITVLVVALFAVILTSMIGNLTAISRLLFAFGRDHNWTGKLGVLNKHRIPSRAVLVTVAISVFVPFLGRTAIGWIVDVTTLGAAIIYGFLSYCVFRDARKQGDRTETVTGAAGSVLMLLVAFLLLAPKIISYEAMAPESYLLFAVWAMLGLIVFRLVLTRDGNNQYGQSIIVWVMLLLLVLFTAMMWMNRISQMVTEVSMTSVKQYYSEYIEPGKIPEDEAEEFISEQMERIDSSNVRNTFTAFAVVIIAVGIMAYNYRTARDREKMWMEKLGLANEIGLRDSLTGVKNKHAYAQWEERIDRKLKAGENEPFAIAVCDINDLKLVNDRLGHLAGDECIQKACKEICRVFSHSPVFRYGGDEFVVIMTGEDYEHRQDHLDEMNRMAEKAMKAKENAISIGMAEFIRGDHEFVQDVFNVADHRMYERKKQLKEKNAGGRFRG